MTQLSTTPETSLLTQQPCTRGNHAAIQELLFFAQKNKQLTSAQALDVLDAGPSPSPSNEQTDPTTEAVSYSKLSASNGKRYY